MIVWVLAVIVCLSVCLSHAGIVSKWLNVGSRKQLHEIAQGLCYFLMPTVIGGRTPYRLQFVLKVTHPLGPAFVAEWLTHSAAMCSRA